MPPKPYQVAITHRHICESLNCSYLDKIDYTDPCIGCPDGHFGPWVRCGESHVAFVPVHVPEHRPIPPPIPFPIPSSNGRSVRRFGEGPGTELKHILAKFGFRPARNCKCNQHINEMNRKGIEWCSNNIDTIVGWLNEEAKRAGLPFIEFGAKILVKKAISNARKKEPKP